MATFDLDEQEQLDAIKQFWRSYGNIIVAVVLAVVIGFGGAKWWQHKNTTAAQSASAAFNKIETAEADGEAMRSLTDALISEHGATYYADLARLNAAKIASENSDYEQAITQLQAVVKNDRDSSLVALAKLRLAALHLITEQYDDAMSALDGDAEASMSGLFADMRGDIYAAQSLNDEALASYQEALSRLRPGNPWMDIVQIKIDSLGSQ